MGETLTQQRRVGEEGLRVVKPFRTGRTLRGDNPRSLTVP
jgi:hypothetical protein